MKPRPFKFLHMADLHFDAPLSSLAFLGAQSQERRLEQKLLFKNTLEMASQKNVDAILIAGDLFEHEYVSRSTVSFINQCFNSIPHIKILISPGNHDPYISNSYYCSYEWASNVHIFKGNVDSVYFEKTNTYIYGAGFDDFLVYKSKIRDLTLHSIDSVNILVIHAAIDSLSGSPGYHPVKAAELEKLGMDYVALGHIHKYMTGFAKGRICYSGSTFALGFDEPGRHGVVFGEVDKDSIKTEFVPVDCREYVVLDVDVTGCRSPQSAVLKTYDLIESRVNMTNYYKIRITGMVDTEVIDQLDLVSRMLMEQLGGNKVVLEYRLLPEYDFHAIALGNDLKAVFVKKLLAEIETETDESNRVKLEKILHIGLCALEGREVKPI